MKLILILVCCLATLQVPPWEKNHQAEGRDLYRENCAVCHDVDIDKKQTRKLGPTLIHLTKQKRPYVAVRVKFGGTLMPAFSKRLSPSQIETLLDYLAGK